MTSAAVFTSLWELVWDWAYWVGVALAVALVPHVLFSRRVSQAKVAWILGILGFPWIGAFFYFAFGQRRLQRRVLRLRGEGAASFQRLDLAYRRAGVFPAPRSGQGQAAADLVAGAEHEGAPPPMPGNEFTLLTEGPVAFGAAREAIDAARQHIHLSTYIFRYDVAGYGALQRLEAAVRRGVEVRVLYDGMGNATSVRAGSGFFDPLRRAGAQVAAFLPVHPFRAPFRANMRNHRKLLVVDGDVAFTGGMNVGDEYATGRGWRDAHCRVRGPVVPSLQRVFAEDWHFATGELLDSEAYYHRPPDAGEVPVQVIASGPDQEDPLADDLMFGAIAAARRSVDIVTPYFVPTEPVEQALRSAALRGRRVRILLGDHVDHRVVRWATDASLPRMLESGVEVWRHPDMVHGKVVVVDGVWATLGSTNLDARSLRLNFELNVALPHAPTAEAILAWFEGELHSSRRLVPEDLETGLGARLVQSAAHLLAPLL